MALRNSINSEANKLFVTGKPYPGRITAIVLPGFKVNKKNSMLKMNPNFKSILPAMLWLVITLIACKPYDGVDPVTASPETVEGWAPIYDSTNYSKKITSSVPRSIIKGGRIYIKDSLLFQVEIGKGIHVISLANKQQPSKIAFIEVVGCQEMSVMGSTLYTNNLNDLVVVDISQPLRVAVVDRISNAFHIFNESYPPSSGWYECPDARKGRVVVGWEMKTLTHPQCSR